MDVAVKTSQIVFICVLASFSLGGPTLAIGLVALTWALIEDLKL